MDGYSPEIRAILQKPTCTVKELALILGVGSNQAYAFVREGKIRSLRIGSRILIPTSAVRELLGDNHEPGT